MAKSYIEEAMMLLQESRTRDTKVTVLSDLDLKTAGGNRLICNIIREQKHKIYKCSSTGYDSRYGLSLQSVEDRTTFNLKSSEMDGSSAFSQSVWDFFVNLRRRSVMDYIALSIYSNSDKKNIIAGIWIQWAINSPYSLYMPLLEDIFGLTEQLLAAMEAKIAEKDKEIAERDARIAQLEGQLKQQQP